jgi:hypothetical protein
MFEELINFPEARLLQVELNQRAEADEVVEKLRAIVHTAEWEPKSLVNNVSPALDKLCFLKRTQTGTFEVVNGPIAEYMLSKPRPCPAFPVHPS